MACASRQDPGFPARLAAASSRKHVGGRSKPLSLTGNDASDDVDMADAPVNDKRDGRRGSYSTGDKRQTAGTQKAQQRQQEHQQAKDGSGAGEGMESFVPGDCVWVSTRARGGRRTQQEKVCALRRGLVLRFGVGVRVGNYSRTGGFRQTLIFLLPIS